jgi:PST family polysaccharide transporter
MARHAVSGTWWSAFQGVANKAATMASMLVVGRFLAPGEYGAAALVLGIGGFIVLLPPAVMGDVLLSFGAEAPRLRRLARRIALVSAVLSSVAIVAAIPVFIGLYPNFPGGTLTALLLVFAVRPLADAVAVAPLVELRGSLRFVSIAAIDGGVQFLATLFTIGLAAGGAGALALVMPQALASVVKAVLYVLAARPGADGPPQARPMDADDASERKILLRQFTVAALAQHAHTLISNLPMLVLGMLSTETETGLYTFAFYLSIQATYVISYQVAIVLQPIFVRLGSDPVRQASGFLRVLAAVGSIAVPLSLLQGVLAEPLLRLLFGERWLEAIPTFAALSVGQAFFFAVAPTMAMLRAQGRFVALLLWQVVQLLLSAGCYAAAARHGALPVAVVDSAVWMIAVPLVAWYCVRGRGAGMAAVLGALGSPWLTALPIAAAAWGCWLLLAPHGLAGVVISVLVVGPVAGVAALFAIRISQPAVYAELAPAVAGAAGRVASARRRLLNRFVTHPDEGQS